MQCKVALNRILDTALEPKKTVKISAKREVEFYSPVFNYANPEGSKYNFTFCDLEYTNYF
jgi:hypothetical protein